MFIQFVLVLPFWNMPLNVIYTLDEQQCTQWGAPPSHGEDGLVLPQRGQQWLREHAARQQREHRKHVLRSGLPQRTQRGHHLLQTELQEQQEEQEQHRSQLNTFKTII